MIDFKVEAEGLRDELIARRRDFHQHPEVGFEVMRTAGLVADELRRLGLEVQTGIGRTGVVATLEGAQDGPTILVRADMDALPIQEETGLPFASCVPGVMHACGHDAHMTIALGVAKLMTQQRQHLAGRIKFMFQPGEEGHGGALEMIADGALKSPVPDVAFGLHVWTELPLGIIGVADGPIMSGSSIFTLIVKGKGGHAAMPYKAIDPVACAGQLITALHTIVGRKMDAMAGAVVLSVTGVHTSSMGFNVIPQEVEIRGTFRTFNAYTSEMLEQHIRSVSEAVCASAGCDVDVWVKHLTIPTINDDEVTRRARKAFERIVHPSCLDEDVRTMASEDMSYILDEVPGMYFFVGAANNSKGITYGHHHPRFDVDEDVLPLGVALLATAVADYLMPEG